MTTIPTTPLTYNSYIAQIATMAVVNTTVAGGTTVASTALVAGTVYVISFVGTTDFTAVGASANSVGIAFTATGTAAGTGTASTGGIVTGVDAEFNQLVPQMINYAELRIQRDLDMQNLEVYRSGYILTSSSNLLSIPLHDFIVIDSIQIASGTANLPLLPVSKEYIQNIYNDSSYTGTPTVFSMYGGDPATTGSSTVSILFGPYADDDYAITITGPARMESLYKFATPTNAGTSYTLISAYLPDLMIMASMIYISAFQRNFGRLNDDPQMAVTYESQYQALLRGATVEEYRKKFLGSDFTSNSMPPATSSARG